MSDNNELAEVLKLLRQAITLLTEYILKGDNK